MVYIFAGVDGSGKSTCFEELRKMCKDETGVVFIKESYTPSLEERIARFCKVADLLKANATIIYDRATILDDLVYSPLTDDQTSQLKELESYASVLQRCKIIHFECGEATLRQRLTERGDEFIRVDDIERIAESYEAVYERYDIKPWRVNTDIYGPRFTADRVHRLIFKKHARMAHIVPVASLDKIAHNNYFMCLAHLVKQSEDYAQFYAELAQQPSKYVLMDNGAAENSQLTKEELLQCYHLIKPNEMVLPDTICNKQDTIRKTREAIRYFVYEQKINCKFMAVPQGNDLREWIACAEEFIRMPEIASLGVSKFLPIKTGDSTIRIHAVSALRSLIKKYCRYDLEVHLLGCDESPSVIRNIFEEYDFVRGCDSAYAYICAQAGERIYTHTTRPSGEIDFLNGSDLDTLEVACQEMELAIGTCINTYDSSWWKQHNRNLVTQDNYDWRF